MQPFPVAAVRASGRRRSIPPMTSQPTEGGLGRRGLLGAGAASAAVPLLAPRQPAAQPSLPPKERPDMTLTLQINSKAHPLTLDPRVTLLDALREHLALTGAKK